MTFERFFEMPKTATFEMPKLRAWVEARLEGRVLNLFGGTTRLVCGPNSVHNDIRSELMPDSSVDAYDPEAIAQLGEFDTVIFDPPYSAFQAVHSYGGVKMQDVTRARESVQRVLVSGGRVISLGWNSTGMGVTRGFEKEALLLVNSGGSHNDIIVLCERHSPASQPVNAQVK